jgi:hypothetical protein
MLRIRPWPAGRDAYQGRADDTASGVMSDPESGPATRSAGKAGAAVGLGAAVGPGAAVGAGVVAGAGVAPPGLPADTTDVPWLTDATLKKTARSADRKPRRIPLTGSACRDARACRRFGIKTSQG